MDVFPACNFENGRPLAKATTPVVWKSRIVDTHVRVIAAARAADVEIVTWLEGPSLWDHVTVQTNGSLENAPMRPDAFFALRARSSQQANAIRYFFLEADRSTTAHARIEAKIRAYVNYFQQGLHSKKYHGVKLFQVLVVTQTVARAENLAASMRSVIPFGAQHAYHFLSLDKLSLGALLPAAPAPGVQGTQ